MSDLAPVLAELKAMRAELAEVRERLDEGDDDILTREQARKKLKVSLRQLQRLVRAGRIMAHPSGIARAELKRYASTPQTKLTATTARRSAVVAEAADLRAQLKLRRRRR